MTRILAIADTHITQAMGLAGAHPTLGGEPLVLVQSRRTMAWISQVAIEHDVDLIIHAGDVFETPRPSPASMAVAVQAFMELSEIAPTVVLTGNHDRPTGGGTHALEFLRNIAPGALIVADDASPIRLRHQRLSLYAAGVPMRADDVVIFPLPYPEKATIANVARGDATNAVISGALDDVLRHHAIEATRVREAGGHPVLAMHGTMRGASFGCRVAPLSDIQIPVAEHWPAFDVQIAGHIHQRQAAPGTGGLPGYVGAPDRMSFGEAGDVPGVSVFTIESEELGADPHPSDPPLRVIDRGVEGATVISEYHVENPGARVYVTIDLGAEDEPGELREVFTAPPFPGEWLPHPTEGVAIPHPMAHRVGELPDETIYRVRGTLTASEHHAVASAIRGWRRDRYIVANETKIAAEDRARITVADAERLNLDEVIDQVLIARPDLTAQEPGIRSGLHELMGSKE